MRHDFATWLDALLSVEVFELWTPNGETRVVLTRKWFAQAEESARRHSVKENEELRR